MDTKQKAKGTLRREVEDLSSELDEHDGEVVSVGEILERASQRAFAPLLIVPALLNILPTGAIPGVTLATGVVITSVGVQLALERDQPWLPSAVTRLKLKNKAVQNALEKAMPWVRRIEKLVRTRLTFVSEKPFSQITAGICIAMGLLSIAFLWLPLASLLPGLAVLALGIGLLSRDGIVVFVGYALGAASLAPIIAALLAI